MSSPPSNKKRALLCLREGNKPIQVQYLIRSLKRDSATQVKGYILQSESTLPITLMGLGRMLILKLTAPFQEGFIIPRD
ncbi:hypothetical protein CEXT_65651 [Caerostris extrusa]|uniref:Uncharacterized protein n=1 Tax=Caerostris extrusa TaxID=172846 RepID=A0AAV4R222_CAEEX|nr:hypothetical protein CEXT_65651 [Caerostris extrusa]